MNVPGYLRIYRIDDLIRESGFSRWTIRKAIKLGALPRAEGRGRAAFYTDRHLNILLQRRRDKDEYATWNDYAERRKIGATP